jgi:hypothetical protein
MEETAVKKPLSALETRLLLACILALLLACLGPAVAQYAHYHAFADQRAWWGVPHAMDVLSNLPFAVGGAWGLVQLWRYRLARSVQRGLAAWFFGGLVVTAFCSGAYHWQPADSGLALDRLGIVLAFAGLLGLAVADRVSDRAGVATLAVLLLGGSLAVGVWMLSGNLLPWVVLQGGGMLLVVWLALCRPVAGAWGLPLGTVVALYALAKLLELGDHSVLAWTAGWVSGHSLKHVVAALVAWPVLACMARQRGPVTLPVMPGRYSL